MIHPEFSKTISKDTSIVVTGAGGFIGGGLIKSLREAGYTKLRAVDQKQFDKWYFTDAASDNQILDLKEKEACVKALDGQQIVFNLAADMGGMGFIEHHKAECMLSVLINTHMLMAAKDTKPEKFFFSSSACAYNIDKQQNTDVTALKEEDAYPAQAEDGYGWEKLFSERMCRHFLEDYGLETRVARYHNVYGPHGTYDGGREKAPAAICRKVAEAILSRKNGIEIWGDGHQTRSFMYIDDCVYGTTMLTVGEFKDPINLGSSELVSINQLVDIVEEIAGVKLERHYKLDAPKGVRGRNSDNTLIKKEFGWEPSIPLREGMEKTYSWIFDEMKRGADSSRYH